MLVPETVNRNEYGSWTHSAHIELFGDREAITKAEWDEWCDKHNIEAAFLEMRDDLPEEDALWATYFEDGDPDFSKWSPKPPGQEWRMLSIHEAEYGPIVIWYREKQEGSGHE